MVIMYIFANFDTMRTSLFVLFISLTSALHAQTFELGALLGGSNYIGDIGPDSYINPNELALGAVFKYNVHSRYSYRASVLFTDLSSNDLDASNSARQQRGYRFSNRILEASVGMEFNFLEFNLHDFSRPATPYIFGGVSYVSMQDLFFTSQTASSSGNKSTFAIPMGLGLKAKVGDRFVIAGEITARYTVSDNLDGSNPDPSNIANGGRIFGNTFSHDWFVFSGVLITYTFGKKPCYFCFE